MAALMLAVTSIWAVIPRDVCLTLAVSDACCVCPDSSKTACCAMPCCAGHESSSANGKSSDGAKTHQEKKDHDSRQLPCWNVSSVDTLTLTLDTYRPQVISKVALLPAVMLPLPLESAEKSKHLADFNEASFRAGLSGASNSCVLRI